MIKPDLSGIVTEEAASADPIIPVAPAPVRILNEDGSVGLAPEPQPQGNDTEPKASPRKAAAMKKVQESPEDPQAAQEAAAASADPEPKVDLPAGVYDANAPDYDSSVRTDLSPKSPADRATKQGLTPTLIAEITNPQPSTSYKFRYSVCEQRAIGYFVSPCPDDKAVADSGWITAGSWTVPPSKLKADSTYFWMVQGQGGSGWSIGYGTAYFATGDKLDTGLPAVAKGVAPAIGVTVSTTIPSLESRVEDGVAGVSYEFNFQVEQGDKAIWNSGWLKDSKTTVSEKQLYWNANYTWSTAIRKSGTTDASIYYASGSFQVAVPEQNGSAAWASEGTSQTVRGVNLGSGGYSTASTDATLKLGAASFDIGRAYRSGNTGSGVFGQGWSSVLDMKVRQNQNVLGTFVTMPNGREYAYATNPDGTFAPSLSNPSTILTKNKDTADWSIREADGTSYVFDGSGLKGMSSPYGAALKVERDINGKPVMLQDGYSNRTLSLTWSGNQLASVEAGPKVDGANVRWDYTYAGNLLNKVCAPGPGTTQNCTKYSYQGVGQQASLTEITAPSGRSIVKVRYTDDGTVAAIVSPANGTADFSWSKNGNSTQVTIKASESPQAGNYVLDGSGRTTKFTNALGGESSWIYDPSGRLASNRTPEGGRTDYKYNAKNQLVKQKIWRTPDTVTYRYTSYSSDGISVWQQDTAQGSYRTNKDQNGRVTDYRVSCGFWCTSEILKKYTYTDGSEASSDSGKVPANLLKTETNPLGGITTYQYDRTGLPTSKIAPSGLVTTYFYDALGRVVRISEAGDGATSSQSFQLDSNGLVAISTADEDRDDTTGLVRQLKVGTVRDADGLLQSSTVTDIKSGKAQVTKYGYDSAGRQTLVTGPNNVDIGATTYSPGGLIASLSGPNRSEEAYAYDAAGNKLSTTVKNFRDPVSGRSDDLQIQQVSYDSSSKPITETDARGQVWGISYSSDGYITKVIAVGRSGAPNWIQTENTLDRYGNPAVQKQSNGIREIVTQFDNMRRPNISSVSVPASDGSPAYSLGEMTTYDGMGNIASSLRYMPNAADPASSVSYWKKNDIDTSGRTTASRNFHLAPGTNGGYPQYVEDLVERFGYDSRGRQVQATDGRGSVLGDPAFTTESSYSASGLLTSVRGPEVPVVSGASSQASRAVTRFGYDEFGRQSVTVAPDGARTVNDLDDFGRTVKTTLPSLQLADGSVAAPTVSFAYNDAGDVLSKTAAGGQSSVFTYDSLGRVVQRADSGASPSAGQRITKTSYRDDGLPDTVEDPAGLKTSFGYDELGRKTSQAVTAPGSETRTTNFGYDAPGNLVSTTAPNGAVTKNAYDVLGQKTAQIDPDGVKQTFAYDSRGNLTRTTDALGQVTLQAYDFASRPTTSSVQDAAGTVVAGTDKAYDLAGNLISVTGALGTGIKQEWDGANRLLNRIEATGAKTAMQYDLRGNSVKIVDPMSRITSYDYNALGWKTKEELPSASDGQPLSERTRSWGYDLNGLVTKINEPGAVTTTQSYDLDGNLLQQDGTGAEAATSSRVLTYDQLGRVASASHPAGTQTFAYDAWGNLTRSNGPAGVSSASFDKVGQLTNRTDAAGSASFEWTAAGRLKSITDAANTLNSTFAYNPAGLISNRTNNGTNVVSRYQQDPAGRLVSEKITAGTSTLYDWQGTYDAAARLIESKQNTPGVAGQGITQYSYDADNRTTGWKDPSGATSSISYDKSGNITNLAGVNRTYDQQNRLLTNGDTTFTWTPRGTLKSQTIPTKDSTPEQITSYTFDAFGQLVKDGTGTNNYDGLKRLAKAGDTTFSYSGTNRSPSSAGVSGWLRSPSGSPWATNTGSYLISNSRGDVLASMTGGQIDSSTTYTPYGSSNSVEKPGRSLGYQSSWTSNAGLVNMDARWYSPTLAGFISRDDAEVPLNQINRYAYAGGNPINNADPSGNLYVPPPGIDWNTIRIGIGAAGSAAGAAAGGAASIGIGGLLWPAASAVAFGTWGYATLSGANDINQSLNNMGKIAGGMGGGLQGFYNWANAPRTAPEIPYRAPGKTGSAPNWNPWPNGLNLGLTYRATTWGAQSSLYSNTAASLVAAGQAQYDMREAAARVERMAAWTIQEAARSAAWAAQEARWAAEAAALLARTEAFWKGFLGGLGTAFDGFGSSMAAFNTTMTQWNASMRDESIGRPWAIGNSTAAGGAINNGPSSSGPNLEHPRIDPPRITTQQLPVDPSPAGAGAGMKPPVCTPAPVGGSGESPGSESQADELGVVYYRTDATGNLKPYVGQSKTNSRYVNRQKEHGRNTPSSNFDFDVVGRAPQGVELDKLEEDFIRRCGGPTNKSNPNGGLSNKRYEMNDIRYQENGGTVPKPSSN
ncbi:RHS repeat-associated core domain-containing protein [Arthrobacter russicus]